METSSLEKECHSTLHDTSKRPDVKKIEKTGIQFIPNVMQHSMPGTVCCYHVYSYLLKEKSLLKST
jgi:hypothetical protein